MSKLFEYNNPFNDNHLFSNADLKRHKLTFRDRIACMFHPMKVQITTEGTWFFKTRRGQYYFYKFIARKETK